MAIKSLGRKIADHRQQQVVVKLTPQEAEQLDQLLDGGQSIDYRALDRVSRKLKTARLAGGTVRRASG